MHSLSAFLSLSGLKEECYALGRLSQLLGKELNSFAREVYPYSPSPQRQATVILIDRVCAVLFMPQLFAFVYVCASADRSRRLI